MHAAHVAARGYRVLVPDLYRGKLSLEAAEAMHLMTSLDFPGAVQDIAGAAGHLKAEGSRKVACIGFCMGGALSLAAGVLAAGAVDAAVPFYGVPPPALCDLAQLKVPVLGHYGALDTGTTGDRVAAGIAAAGVAGTVHVYDGVGHAFMNASPAGNERRAKLGQGAHVQAAVELAWQRTFAFLEEQLA